METGQRLTDRKRASIVEAAVAEFQECGFAGARINRIAERAEVSKRTLYKHFESKDALFDEIIEIIMQRNASVRHVTFDPERPIRDQLIEEVQAVAQLADESYIELNRLLASEYLRNDDLARRVFSREEVTTEPLVPFLQAAMDQSVLRTADPTMAAAQLGALAKQFFIWPQFLTGQAAPWSWPQEDIIADCVDMFLAHYSSK